MKWLLYGFVILITLSAIAHAAPKELSKSAKADLQMKAIASDYTRLKLENQGLKGEVDDLQRTIQELRRKMNNVYDRCQS